MGVVFDLILKLAKAVPVLIQKIMTIMLLVFTLGLFIGYSMTSAGQAMTVFLIPIVAMLVMWHKLDEGVLVLVLLLVAVFFYPNALGL